jgi:oligoribonuclease (3'-5' exoribonuclease)
VTPFIALDCETSGLDPEHDVILSLALVAETGD